MTTETVADTYQDLDLWPLDKTLEALIDSNRRAADAVARALPDLTRAAEETARRLEAGGRLVYIGAGTSGRLAVQDAAELPPTFGFERSLVLMAGSDAAKEQAQENAEDDASAAQAAVKAAKLGPDDAVIGLAASGTTPYTVAGVKQARQQGAFTVGVANNPATPLLSGAEVGVLLETGAEVLAGSTRLAAGTAQKIFLNALSTAVLVKLGGAYGNLMVGMKPRNDKLNRRALGIVARASGAAEGEAVKALEATGGRIREAIVMLETGVSAEAAAARLARTGGRVREALEELV